MRVSNVFLGYVEVILSLSLSPSLTPHCVQCVQRASSGTTTTDYGDPLILDT